MVKTGVLLLLYTVLVAGLAAPEVGIPRAAMFGIVFFPLSFMFAELSMDGEE